MLERGDLVRREGEKVWHYIMKIFESGMDLGRKQVKHPLLEMRHLLFI